jgi:hypothetical protein
VWKSIIPSTFNAGHNIKTVTSGPFVEPVHDAWAQACEVTGLETLAGLQDCVIIVNSAIIS